MVRKAKKKKKRRSLGGLPGRWWLLGATFVLVVGVAWIVWPYWRLSGQFGQLSLPHPSRLYGRPMTLEPGDFRSVSSLESYLVDLGYRRVDIEPTQGNYRRTSSPTTLEAFLRPYPTLGGLTAAQTFRIVFWGRRVTRLELAGREVDEVELEPPVLASYYGSSRVERRPVDLEKLPRELVLAVLAAEDAAFFEHAGISPTGVMRAAWVNLRSGEVVQGGSTLTQQLVKNLYLTHERTFVRKLREAVLSIFLELRFEKEKLLETYLNEIYWGREGPVNLLGVGAAARAYFGKEATELTLNEAVVLAGMIQTPGRLDPRLHPEASRARRDQVLERIGDLNWMETGRLQAVRAMDLPPTVRPRAHRYQSYLMDAVAREARDRFGVKGLVDTGFSLLTTLDADDQAEAEEAVKAGLEKLEGEGKSELQGLLLSIDPRDGGVLAYVGGRDYSSSQFDRIGLAKRQPGSAFKPVVFATAFESLDATPATLLEDAPLTLRVGSKSWSPKNYDRRFRGWISAREALESSVNIPTVRLGEQVGWERIVAMGRELGIENRLQPMPSIALGAFEVTPWELMTVYGTFANGGRRRELHLLRGVLNPRGEPLSAPGPLETVQAIDAQTAYLVNHLLQGALDRGTGRGVRAHGLYEPLAGKTGTTNGGRDNWFAGYAPNRAMLVWVGYDDNRETRFSGARAALPIWARFAVARRPVGGYAGFRAPPGIVFAPVDELSGQLATGRCRDVRTEAFLERSLPLPMCELHSRDRPLEERELRDDRRPRSWWRRVFGRRPRPVSPDV